MTRSVFIPKVGFQKHTDALFGEMRWLTLCPQGNQNFEIALMLPETDEDRALIGRQGGSYPLACFITDNCVQDYEKYEILVVWNFFLSQINKNGERKPSLKIFMEIYLIWWNYQNNESTFLD